MLRFFPWKYIVSQAARRFGVIDPAIWLARLRQFSQPSEVQEPIELLRAGIEFHARGVVNTKAIQHNLDWVWPFWVERQFDPSDHAFVPRAFSFSHINLTHRNWTAVGLPDLALYPVIDPHGLVTPLHDGWSLDFWVFAADGKRLIPSRLPDGAVRQQLITESSLAVETTCSADGMTLSQTAEMLSTATGPELQVRIQASAAGLSRLVAAVRPYNPEGVQFVDHIGFDKELRHCHVNHRTDVIFDRGADQFRVSRYDSGDVSHDETQSGPDREISCAAGMATAAALFDFHDSTTLQVNIPLAEECQTSGNAGKLQGQVSWPVARSEAALLQIPDARIQRLYQTAVDTLLLLSADDIVPGPYTYRRFWFRDACLMAHSLLTIGLVDRCRTALERFPSRQNRKGYFQSQDGEWDSNGQVLWIADRYVQMTGRPLPPEWNRALDKAVQWIDRKRVRAAGERHDGLMPPGFSAEHLGPNDYYYWDAFWSVAGLQGAASLYRRQRREKRAAHAEKVAAELSSAIDASIRSIPDRNAQGAIPASPYRRLDAGAVGSLVVDYPLRLFPAGDARVMKTIDGLLEHNFHSGGFFQDMIHSGINAYLTLDIAQSLLRAGDPRYRRLILAVADLASPTGHWPEAVHPWTGGGCMGDGQHGWAAAEWVMAIRNCFVREEADRLVVGSGVFPEWLAGGEEISFGPTLTSWGPVSVRLIPGRGDPEPSGTGESHSATLITIDGHWRGSAPRVDVTLPGCEPLIAVDTTRSITVCPPEHRPTARIQR